MLRDYKAILNLNLNLMAPYNEPVMIISFAFNINTFNLKVYFPQRISDFNNANDNKYSHYVLF